MKASGTPAKASGLISRFCAANVLVRFRGDHRLFDAQGETPRALIYPWIDHR
jgi:hypothetical protein